MILVSEGNFSMGSDTGNWDESPQREVWVDAFLMDEFPVTQAEYKRFVDDAAYPPPSLGLAWSAPYDWKGNLFPEGRENHPVVLVSWLDAQAYCEWAGKRLPTEAEWEKAARGTDGRTWPWGNEWNTQKCACSGAGDVLKLGGFPNGVSPFGCQEMAGNVWEWIQDWYDGKYYSKAPSRNPQGPMASSDGERVLKGGAWIHADFSLRCAMRYHRAPNYRDNYIGFRCVKPA